jgi:hypothetical protein
MLLVFSLLALPFIFLLENIRPDPGSSHMHQSFRLTDIDRLNIYNYSFIPAHVYILALSPTGIHKLLSFITYRSSFQIKYHPLHMPTEISFDLRMKFRGFQGWKI